MIVGQENDLAAKFAQMIAMQQQPAQQGSVPPYTSIGTGTAGLNSYNPSEGYQPPVPDDFTPPVGIYGPTSIIGKEYAAQQGNIPSPDSPYTQQEVPIGSMPTAPGDFYGPTSQMAKDMGTGPGPSAGSEAYTLNQGRMGNGDQNIEYYRQALANMLQQMNGGAR